MVLPAEVEDLIASLRLQIATLEAKVAELSRQLGQDSSNSSKPPSSDGLKKKPRVAGSLRGRSGKASGGQKGHKGDTLRQVADPDCVIKHTACACRHCGSPLDPQAAVRIEKRQVFDLAERPLVVTEHQAAIYRCAGCRGETKAAFPDGVVSLTQYGDLHGGVIVHDHFLPYRRLDTVAHAFCNAHILRELNSLIEFDKEAWAELMRDMLLAANLAVNKARQAGAAALAPAELQALLERYWAAIRLGLAFHRQLPNLEAKAKARGRTKHRPGHNLLQRLKTFQTETLRFLTDFDVPFTNNLAEQDLRMMKVKMKISGSFRTLEGARNLRDPSDPSFQPRESTAAISSELSPHARIRSPSPSPHSRRLAELFFSRRSPVSL